MNSITSAAKKGKRAQFKEYGSKAQAIRDVLANLTSEEIKDLKGVISICKSKGINVSDSFLSSTRKKFMERQGMIPKTEKKGKPTSEITETEWATIISALSIIGSASRMQSILSHLQKLIGG